MRRVGPYLAMTLALVLAAGPDGRTAEGRELRAAHNDRVIVLYRAIDEREGRLARADAQQCATYAQAAIERFEAMKLRPPCLRVYKGRFVIGIVDFAATGDPVQATGRYFPRQRKIRINLAKLKDVGTQPWNQGRRAVEGAIAHEIFHAIQYAYGAPATRPGGGCTAAGPGEPSWFKEATANWAADTVVPDLHYCVVKEAMNLTTPGPYHWFEGRDIFANARRGRAYGASAFFRFWAGIQGVDVLRRLFEACERPGDNAFEAVGAVMGDDGPLGTRFRELFDRFRVGCVLRPDLPEGTELADAGFLRQGTPRRRGPLRPPITSLSADLRRHFPAGRPQAVPFQHEVRLRPLETRYFGFVPPAGLPDGTRLEVRLEPADAAMGAQLLLPGSPRYTVERFTAPAPASFTPSRLPAGRGVGVIVTRYEASGGDAKRYRLVITASEASPFAFSFSQVRFKDLTLKDGGVQRILVGEVKNEGTTPVTNPLIRVRGEAGPVRLGSTHIPVRELAPGASTSFKITGAPQEIPHGDLEVYNLHEAEFSPIADSIAFEEVFLKLTYDPRYKPPQRTVEVVARLKNTWGKRLTPGENEPKRLLLTLYNAAGEMIGVDTDFVHEPALQPGALSRSIEVKCLLLAEAPSAIRLTARVGDSHYCERRFELGRLGARFVGTIQKDGHPEDEIVSECDLPAWVFPVWILDKGGVADRNLANVRSTGTPIANGEKASFFNAFASRTVQTLAGCWIEVPLK